MYKQLCPVCCNSTTIINGGFLSRCAHCLHIFQTDMKISVNYDTSYLDNYLKLGRQSDILSAARIGLVLGILNLRPGARILDIGYASGSFLKAMSRLGYDVYGMDLHGQDMGIREVTFETPYIYDLICFFDSLEHFDDLCRPIRLQARNVIVSLPSIPDFFPAFPQKWRHYKLGEHLHYFTPESLKYFMHRWGFSQCLAEGYPEDVVRGRLVVEDHTYPNIYTAVFSRKNI